MSGPWISRYIAEFFGTAILVILGNGAVANSFLKELQLMEQMVNQTVVGILSLGVLALE